MRQLTRLVVLLLGVSALACNKTEAPVAATKANTTAPVAPAPEYDLASLAKDLRANSTQKRDTAIKSASELDEGGTDVVPTLLEALKDSGGSTTPGDTSERPTSTRETAVQALLKLGSKGKKALTSTGLNSLVDGTKDSKATVREHAVNAIGMVGPDAKGVVDAVAVLCADKDVHVRGAAYRALQKIKNPPQVTIVKLLTNADIGIATDAATSLSWVKPNSPETVPLLLEALKLEPSEKVTLDKVTYIRNAAADAIANNGKQAEVAIPQLVDLLKKTPADQVENLFRPTKPGEKRTFTSGAVSALRKIGKPVLPALTPLLKDEQPIVRYQAALVIGGMGTDADEAKQAVLDALELERGLPTGQLLVFEELALTAIDLGCDQAKITDQVAKLLSDDQIGTRYRATFMIARLGRSAASAAPKLSEMLNELEPQVQVAALEALAAIGPSAKMALPEVIKKIDGDDTNAARAAAKVIRSLGAEATTAVPALIKALDANDPGYCLEVIQTLGVMGPSAAEAVPALTKMLEAENTRNEERVEIFQALAAMGPAAKSAIPALMKYTTAKEFNLRSMSATTLGKIGTGNAEVLKKLTEMLKDGQLTVRVAVLKALAAQGPAAKSAAAEIKAMGEKTTGTDLKLWVAATLVALGSDTEANLKVITEALKNKKPEARPARGTALDTVALLGPKAKGTVPDLIDALKDKTVPLRPERPPLRERAARAVGALGESAKEATSALTDLLREPDLNLRKAAVESLGAIGPSAVLAVPKLKELARNDTQVTYEVNKALELISPPKKLD